MTILSKRIERDRVKLALQALGFAPADVRSANLELEVVHIELIVHDSAGEPLALDGDAVTYDHEMRIV